MSNTVFDLNEYCMGLPKPKTSRSIGYNMQVVWGGMFLIEKEPFCANELRLIIKEVFKFDWHSSRVAKYLKDFVNMGYVERKRDKLYYEYRFTSAFKQLQEAWL